MRRRSPCPSGRLRRAAAPPCWLMTFLDQDRTSPGSMGPDARRPAPRGALVNAQPVASCWGRASLHPMGNGRDLASASWITWIGASCAIVLAGDPELRIVGLLLFFAYPAPRSRSLRDLFWLSTALMKTHSVICRGREPSSELCSSLNLRALSAEPGPLAWYKQRAANWSLC